MREVVCGAGARTWRPRGAPARRWACATVGALVCLASAPAVRACTSGVVQNVTQVPGTISVLPPPSAPLPAGVCSWRVAPPSVPAGSVLGASIFWIDLNGGANCTDAFIAFYSGSAGVRGDLLASFCTARDSPIDTPDGAEELWVDVVVKQGNDGAQGVVVQLQFDDAPTPSPSPTATATPTPTQQIESPSASPSSSPSASPSASPTPTSPGPELSPTPSPSPSPSPSASASASASPSASPTSGPELSPTTSPSPTPSPSATTTASPSASPSANPTPSPPNPDSSASPSPTPTASASPTSSGPEQSTTPTPTPTPTASASPVASSDCVLGAWGAWGTCTETCGGQGVQQRVRSVERGAVGGGVGRSCAEVAGVAGALEAVTDVQECNTQDCGAPVPVPSGESPDCELGPWEPAGNCSVACGGAGVVVQTRSVLRARWDAGREGGAPCTASQLSRTVPCDMGSCDGPPEPSGSDWPPNGQLPLACQFPSTPEVLAGRRGSLSAGAVEAAVSPSPLPFPSASPPVVPALECAWAIPAAEDELVVVDVLWVGLGGGNRCSGSGVPSGADSSSLRVFGNGDDILVDVCAVGAGGGLFPSLHVVSTGSARLQLVVGANRPRPGANRGFNVTWSVQAAPSPSPSPTPSITPSPGASRSPSPTPSSSPSAAPAPVDCVLSPWSAWGECSEFCGVTGWQERTRSVLEPARNGGSCDANLTDTQPCFEPCSSSDDADDDPEPTDCVLSPWTPASACVPTAGGCGAGTWMETRTIVSEATGGGTPCPPASELQRTAPCAGPPCADPLDACDPQKRPLELRASSGAVRIDALPPGRVCAWDVVGDFDWQRLNVALERVRIEPGQDDDVVCGGTGVTVHDPLEASDDASHDDAMGGSSGARIAPVACGTLVPSQLALPFGRSVSGRTFRVLVLVSDNSTAPQSLAFSWNATFVEPPAPALADRAATVTLRILPEWRQAHGTNGPLLLQKLQTELVSSLTPAEPWRARLDPSSLLFERPCSSSPSSVLCGGATVDAVLLPGFIASGSSSTDPAVGALLTSLLLALEGFSGSAPSVPASSPFFAGTVTRFLDTSHISFLYAQPAAASFEPGQLSLTIKEDMTSGFLNRTVSLRNSNQAQVPLFVNSITLRSSTGPVAPVAWTSVSPQTASIPPANSLSISLSILLSAIPSATRDAGAVALSMDVEHSDPLGPHSVPILLLFPGSGNGGGGGGGDNGRPPPAGPPVLAYAVAGTIIFLVFLLMLVYCCYGRCCGPNRSCCRSGPGGGAVRVPTSDADADKQQAKERRRKRSADDQDDDEEDEADVDRQKLVSGAKGAGARSAHEVEMTTTLDGTPLSEDDDVERGRGARSKEGTKKGAKKGAEGAEGAEGASGRKPREGGAERTFEIGHDEDDDHVDRERRPVPTQQLPSNRITLPARAAAGSPPPPSSAPTAPVSTVAQTPQPAGMSLLALDLKEMPTLADAGEFERLWATSAPIDLWGATLQSELVASSSATLDEAMEAALVRVRVHCIASGAVGGTTKQYFVATDARDRTWLLELSVTPSTGRLSALFKGPRGAERDGEAFVRLVQARLRPLLA